MTTIPERLAAVVADGRVDDAEWTELAAEVEALPRRAGPDARAVLEVWRDTRYEKSAGASEGMKGFLATRGYPVAEAKESDRAADLAARNISELDPAFALLAERTGKIDGPTRIAVIDGGFFAGHPAFSDKLWTNDKELPGNKLDDDGNGLADDVHGYNFADHRGDLETHDWAGLGLNEHGTFMLGIATRGTDRIRAMACTQGNFRAVGDAMQYAVDNGASIVSMSFGVWEDGPALARIRKIIADHPEVLFVHSAGNNGQELGSGNFSEANDFAATVAPNLITVGSSEQDGRRRPRSNFGAHYVLLAARAQFHSAVGSGYITSPGETSEATANVTNIAAKCRLLCPSLSSVELRALLAASCDPEESWRGRAETNGVMNELKAMQLASLVSLMRDGASAEQAAAKLELDDPRLTAEASRFVPVPPAGG